MSTIQKLIAAHDYVIANKDTRGDNHGVLINGFIDTAFELVDHSTPLTDDEKEQIGNIINTGNYKSIFNNDDYNLSDHTAIVSLIQSMIKNNMVPPRYESFKTKFFPYYCDAILNRK